MAIVNQVQKKTRLTKWDIIKYQIMTYCYIKKIAVTDSDLNCMTLLSLNQPIELTHFCYDASSEEDCIFKSIPKFQNILEKHDTSTYAAYYNKKMIENKLDLLIQLEHMIIIEETRKKTFKKNKYE